METLLGYPVKHTDFGSDKPKEVTLGGLHVMQYAALLALLNVLVDDERGDSEEADALRDQMDPLWYKMTPEERKWVFKRNGDD